MHKRIVFCVLPVFAIDIAFAENHAWNFIFFYICIFQNILIWSYMCLSIQKEWLGLFF